MAVIENGVLKGVIPEKTLFAVNYPGYPESTSRAVETLGGTDAISKARLSETNYLELRFRPEDPFSHAVFGELHGSSGLLLELSTGKDEKGGQIVKGNMVAKVNQSYEFSGMADYQFVAPVHLNLENGKKRRRVQEQGGQGDLEQEEMMVLPPPFFSVKDVPEELILQPSEYLRASQRKALLCQHAWEVDMAACFNLDFKIKEVPPKVNWEENMSKDSPDWPVQAALAKLFEERPIWAKPTINDRLIENGFCLNDMQLRRSLFRISYYFAYGPFRTLWIKKGYDPRKDPESRVFQMVDFRIPKPVRKAAQAYLIERGEEAAGITWRDICSFKEAPAKKFSYLQLYDLEDDYIQSQIRRPPEQPSCNEYSGWFKRSSIVRLRHHVRVRYLDLIPGNTARELKELECRRLENLKRFDIMRQNQPMIIMPGDMTDIKDVSGQIDEGLQQEGNLGADDEEEEEEEDEEEEDDDQPLEELTFVHDVHGADNYMDALDTIPRSYLQELLEKFPLSRGDNVGAPAGNICLSDEETEYAIYEQNEDDEDED